MANPAVVFVNYPTDKTLWNGPCLYLKSQMYYLFYLFIYLLGFNKLEMEQAPFKTMYWIIPLP